MTEDLWHFRRAGLAGQVLGTLAHGPAQALSLFAPAKGHRVIYTSFWQAPLSPLAVLLHGSGIWGVDCGWGGGGGVRVHPRPQRGARMVYSVGTR